ncbi:RagB/SusD family nutrient uptake outer membrane protein [Segatella maculosa]|uniref:RagB/SusD family nutrient uptake outer membrane protein n=1 Tax=Segatella maculosa TaxID=439703 RepID=UPI0023F23E0F|nr:RagB/SusD family nutrient uptake outer membrane protein [Segatella maculosa]
MKHYHILLGAVLLLGASVASCTDQIKFGDAFLDKAPGNDVTKDTVFNNPEYTRNFLWSCYGKLHYGLPYCWTGGEAQGMNTGVIDALSDCIHSHCDWDEVNRQYYAGAYTAPSKGGDDHGRFPYMNYNVWETVRACYIFLENVDHTPNMEASEKERLKAEAKSIIASRYFDLFRNYGGLPLVRKSYDGTDAVYEIPRTTVDETVKFIVGLLDEAAPKLPWALGSELSNWEGRFTQAGVMGLKAKVLNFAASPLFNNATPYCTTGNQEANEKRQAWYGDYQEARWQAVVDACKAFFDKVNSLGWYALVQADNNTPGGYRAAFRKAYSDRGTTEVLISTRVKYQDSQDWQYLFSEWNGLGGYTPTEEYQEMFGWKDGSPFDYDELERHGDLDRMFIVPGKPKELTRDPRLYETIIVNGTLNRMDANGNMSGRQVEAWVNGNEGSGISTESGQYATGMANNKFYMNKVDSKNHVLSWPYLRMAEMHLIYAEALAQTGQTAKAIEQVDKVRARVGLKGLVASDPATDYTKKDNLIEAILHERACEFGFEESRFYDMIRYRRADLFGKTLHALRIYRLNPDGTDNNTPYLGNENSKPFPTHFRYERMPLKNKSRAWWTSFDPKWYLSAFPTAEVNKGYGLTQNPGW